MKDCENHITATALRLFLAGMGKRMGVVILSVCGVIFCIALVVDGFIPESIALWSRVTHRSHQTLNGYEFEAPFGWGISEHRDQLNFFKGRGRVRSYLFGSSGQDIGFYTVAGRKDPVDYNNVVAFLRNRAHERIRKIEERKVAGKKMVCIQSSLPEFPEILDVMCVPDGSIDGISATYTGDAEHVPEFFAILDSVKKTN